MAKEKLYEITQTKEGYYCIKLPKNACLRSDGTIEGDIYNNLCSNVGGMVGLFRSEGAAKSFAYNNIDIIQQYCNNCTEVEKLNNSLEIIEQIRKTLKDNAYLSNESLVYKIFDLFNVIAKGT